MTYNFKAIERKWQKKWEAKKVFQVKEGKSKKKFYCLEMFPYPSATGLHMGHALNYTIGDIYARFKRMQGFNVLYPMGYDGFGLPAENAAIQAKEHPRRYAEKAIKNYIRQQKSLGLSYDWSRIIKTCDEDYYKWNQFWFLKLLEKGLVYRKKAPVNWCSKCKTVLANEQVHNGKCWRHSDVEIETKHLEQWFIKTTKYADEILKMIDKLEWPERIKIMQKNWIGKSFGSEIIFVVDGKKWPIFTTRADTIYGVTFMVISTQHPKLMSLVTKSQKRKVEDFLKKSKKMDERELEKQGVFTGSYAINPINNEKIPVWVGNFVVADYGCGMVMGVPAHDQRDFEFAKKYGIKIKEVVKGGNVKERAYVSDGVLVNSSKFNGMRNKKAAEEITKYLKTKKLGRKVVQYKLRDWLVSRQRYWGTPIPVIYCDKCGIVPEKNIPVKLPEKVRFGKGNPLLTNKNFIEVKCPKCKSKARRETDTMDTFFDSSWYYLRYCDNKNKKKPFEKNKIKYWMPVDQYIGGAEHACMHLIYARFFTKALRDMGFVKFDEPFIKLFNQGMLYGSDGNKMSKSLGNVVIPEEVSKKYGIDSARLFLVSVASPDKDVQWSEKGIQGSFRFVKKVFEYFSKVGVGKSSARLESKLNKSIKEISKDIENFNYNLAVIKLRSLFNSFSEEHISKKDAESFLKLLSVFCPHIAEELWEKIENSGFVSLAKWPIYDKRKINEKLEKQEDMVIKTAEDINNILRIVKAKEKKIKKAVVYVLPNEKKVFVDGVEMIKKKTGIKVEIFAVNDKNKYDPRNKSRNVKPGRPGIYLE